MTFRVAHLTTVDLSLRFLVMPQLLAVVDAGGQAVGISSPGPWVEDLTSRGIRHIPLEDSTRGMNPLKDLKAALQLWRVLRREEFTVLHTHNPKPGLYGRVLGRLAGVPLVVNTMHGFYATEDDSFWNRAVVYTLEAIASRFSDVELHQNPEDLELAKRLRIVPRKRGSLLGNGVDLSRFDGTTVDADTRTKIRAELGVTDSEIVIGIVGRLVAEKGYPELFEAFAGLDERFRLVVVGPDDPDKPDALPRELIESATSAGVMFLGMRTDVHELYTAMDLFVLPSHREGFPRAAMEAAASGLPLVVTNIRGCRQVVDDGVNGTLVPVQDPEALREAIQIVGADADRRIEMASASRIKAQNEFDERRIVEIVMSSYRVGLVAKGLGHLLPESMVTTSASTVRPATAEDAAAIAGLHVTELSTGFLPRLGHRFMTVLYEAMISWKGATVLVVADDAGPVGFISGVTSTGSFYKYFLRQYGFRAVWAAAPKLLANLGRAWESFRYGSEEVAVPAELLSLAVAERARGRGLGFTLGEELLTAMQEMGCEAVRVVVAEENVAAIGAYEKMGFAEPTTIEVHRGEKSRMMVWRAS